MSATLYQPVHTVYGGAHLFRYDVAGKLGRLALQAFDAHRALLPGTDTVHQRVRARLEWIPVQDYRIDFEDGYGYRAAEEEDAHAAAAAQQVSEGMLAGTLPPFLGIRPKSFHAATRQRSIQTLRIFFKTLPEPPEHFTVTLPKAAAPEEVESLCRTLHELGVTCPIELMIETPEALRNLNTLIDVAGGRCRGAHFGPYDFTSSCGIPSASQGLRHPLCTHARNEMLIKLAGTGVWLSDGPTAVLPVGDAVAQAWQTQWEDIQHAHSCGFYQGWDLHPAQITLRYAAVFSFFLDALPSAVRRIKNFQEQEAQATRAGSSFDDEATARGLRIFFDRAVSCGAIIRDELTAMGVH
ncbi:MAG: phosphoenolpyruvate kinase [Acidobacteria bacterium]|nr:phosphoenolpyruvate kinase [Acidobacteriota bacterium]